MSGTSGSGKTSFWIRLLQNNAAHCTEREFGGGIIRCYSEKTAVAKHRLLPSNTTYQEGVPEKFFGGGGKVCLVILDEMLNDVHSKQVCHFLREAAMTEISALFWLRKICSISAATVVIFPWMPNMWSLWKTSEIRSSSCTWRINCTPKIVLGNITPTWMRHKDPEATSSQIWHKIRLTVCGFKPTYSRKNILLSSNPIEAMQRVKSNYHALHVLKSAEPRISKALITS